MELTIPILPPPCSFIFDMAGKTVLAKPSILTENISLVFCAILFDLELEIPAFAITILKGPKSSKTLSRALSSVTSKTDIKTVAPNLRQISSVIFNRRVFLPTNTSFMPGLAYSSASAAPMPEDAPVIRIDVCFFLVKVSRSLHPRKVSIDYPILPLVEASFDDIEYDGIFFVAKRV